MSESMNQNAMKQHNAVLSCRNLSKRYDEGPESVVVLDGLELEPVSYTHLTLPTSDLV